MQEVVGTLSYLLVRLGRRLDRIMTRHAHEAGLSLNEYKLLFLLNNNEGVTLSDAIRETSIDLGQASRSSMQLQRKGLVSLLDDEIDRRKHHLRLTPLGNACFNKLYPERVRLEQSIRIGLKADQLPYLQEVLENILDNILNREDQENS